MIWVISELYFPEDTSTGHYMTRIAEALAKDRPVMVICAKPNYSKRGTPVARRETRNGVEIERCKSTALDKNVFAFKLINIFTVTVSMFLVALRRLKSGDEVLMGTNPPVLPFAIAIACRLKGARYVLRIDDVYPDAMIVIGLISAKGVIAKTINALNRGLCRSAEHVVVMGRDMAEVIKRKHELVDSRVEVISNWADVDEIRPTPRAQNRLLAELGLADKFVIGFAGNLGPLQGVDYLFACALHLKENEAVHFLFIGSGKMASWLEKSVKDSGLKNITLLGQRPRSDQLNFLNACDIGVASLIRGMWGIGVPSRVYNIMAAGKPVIAAVEADSEIARIVEEEKIGWVVPPGEPARFGEAVVQALSVRANLAEMGMRARTAAEAKYSCQRIVEQYQQLMS